MSLSSGAEGTLITSPHEQRADAPVAKTMDTKLMVATSSGDIQQLKDLVNEQEQDSKMMVVVMAKKQAASSMDKPHSQQENMDLHLLALASLGSSEKLQALLNGEDSQASGYGTDGSLTTRRGTTYGDDIEANESILEGVTAEGDTALHVVAACGHGDNSFTSFREAKQHHFLAQQNNNNKKRLPTRTGRLPLTTYGDGDNFLESARIIYGKAKHLLFVPNNIGDTPLHCAARAGKSNMVKCLIDLALAQGEVRVKELLRKENKHKQTALHEAVRTGNKDIVDLLLEKDSELASFPQDGGVSPLYLAIILQRDLIEEALNEKTHGRNLSFTGPNGQNALHAAVLRHQDLTKLLELNKTHLCLQNKDLTTQRDENGSTPLHFAAAVESLFESSSICGKLFEANPDALYQPDHAGFFPIHVAASVGAFRNVDMFVETCPSSAGLRDGKGRTFLHVAVEKKEVNVIRSACRNLSLSWIMNMVDNDGNTALHLAVKAKSIRMFCPLSGNPQVNLNLPNSRGETPLDIAQYSISETSLYNFQTSEVQIYLTLRQIGAVKGVHRQDHLLEDNITLRVHTFGESKETEVLKESTEALCIGSVLIATVTFGVTFAVPGDYIPYDKNNSNAGSPVLAPRYAFRGFIRSNACAFACSTIATISLMRSRDPLFNLWSRKTNLRIAYYLISLSITCLVAAFAFAAYVVLAPLADDAATFICVVTCIILLCNELEFIVTRYLLLKPLCTRKGLTRACAVSACAIIGVMLSHYWPLIFIFLGAVSTKQSPKVQAPAPAPLAST